MAVLFYVVSLLVFGNVQGANILGIFTSPGRSHYMVFETLLWGLSKRGHHVTSINFYPLKDPPANYTDVSLEGMSSFGLASMDFELFEIKFLGIEKLLAKFLILGPIRELALEVCEGIIHLPSVADALKKPYDLVIMEQFNGDCMLGMLHVYGVNAPIVAISSTSLMPWGADRIGLTDNPAHVPLICAYSSNKMDFWQRLENSILQVYFKWFYRLGTQVKEQAILEKHFGRTIPDLRDLAKNISMVLLNSHHSLNGVKPLLPGVVEVGGIHIKKDYKRKPLPQFIERFINESDHGVILISFGSLINTATLPKYKEEMIVNACAKLKQRVIWKYENSGEEGTITGNILRVRWLPQFDLLQHPKVMAFVAHGGLLGMTEAVYSGKPMVVIPFFGDQPNNAASAEAAGLAKVLFYSELSEKALTEAMQQVVSAEMRLKAKMVSEMWRDRPADPLDTAIYWTERVIRWGHHDSLHSPARDLSFIEKNLLDVLAFIALAVIVFLLAIKFLISLIPKFLGLGPKKQKVH